MPEYFDISLKNTRFVAHHGVFPQETVVGNDFMVDLTVTIPSSERFLSLEDTISYADLFKIVSEEMAIPTPLLENVCIRIADRLKNDFPNIISGELEITKVAPPISGIDGSCAVKFRF